VLVLQRNSALVNFLVCKCDLLLLHFPLIQLPGCLNDVVLGELAKHLEFIHQLGLAVHQLLLLC
jgi:hypothetical protein